MLKHLETRYRKSLQEDRANKSLFCQMNRALTDGLCQCSETGSTACPMLTRAKVGFSGKSKKWLNLLAHHSE
jgi:hypothetical protein